MPILSIQNLRKTYKNGTEALKGVSLDIQKGEFTALLGPNGAGKTTLINILVGNTIKSGGTVGVVGFDLDNDPIQIKKQMGVVPQEVSFDSFFTINEILNIQSGYFGVPPDQEYIDELLTKLGLFDKKHTNTRALSGGMRRRLLIAKALVHKPNLFILDEPTAGVDIELRQSLYEYLEKIHKEGTTIVLTTHYLEEAERLCDRIIVINHGSIVADGNKHELLKKFSQCNAGLEVVFSEIPSDFASKFGDVSHEVRGTNIFFRVGKTEIPKLLKRLMETGYEYEDYFVREPKLEDLFVHLINSGSTS